MRFLLLINLILLMMASSGCNNPSGGSVIGRGNAPFLQKPAAFKFTEIKMSNGDVSLKWSKSSRAADYKVYMGTASNDVSTLVPSCTGLITSCSLTGLSTSTLYYFNVVASNDAGTLPINALGVALSVSSFDITGSSVANGQITVSWAPSTGATNYNLLYGFSSGSYSSTVSNVTSPYTLTGLANGKAHYFRVVATNSSNGYAMSDSEGTQVPVGPPATPTGLTLAASPSSMTFSWNQVSGATSYKIFRGTTSGSLSQVATTTVETYTDASTTDGQTYFYAVTAANAIYDSTQSAEVSARSISNFTLTSVTTGSAPNQLIVSWPATTGAATYNIRYGTNASSPSSTLTGVTSPYTVTGLSAGLTYYFKVVGVNNVGVGTSLPTTNQLSGVPITPVVAPTGLAAVASPSQVSLTWNAVAGASSYEVLRGTVSGSYTSVQSGIVGNSYVDNTAINGTAYYYVVRSFNGLSSPNSAEVSAKPVQNFSISSISSVSSTSLQITWSATAGADAYDVRYGTTSGSYTGTATNVTSPYTLTGLTANTTYYVVVRGRNAIGAGTSVQTSQSSAQTKTAAPTGLVATTTPGQISLDWTNTSGAATYSIYRGTTSGSYSSLATGLVTSDYIDTSVTDGVTYFYVVTASNSSESAYSTEVSARSISSFAIASTSSPSPTSITVNWPAVSGAATYDIKYGTVSGTYTTTLSNRTSPSTITGLTAGSTYYIIVVAKNAVGTGSSVNSAQVSQGTPVGPPTGLVATAGTGQISLSWTAMGGASSYKVFRGTTSGTYSQIAANVVPTNYVDSTVTDGTVYYYVVTTYNGADSANSAEVSGKSISAFSISTATAVSSSSINVVFPSTAGGELYDVRYGMTSGTYSTTASAVSSPYTISALTPNTNYYIVVRARNTIGSGTSAQTAELNVKTPTAAPASLAAVSSPGQIALSWGAVTGATSYKVFRGTTSGTYTEIANNVATNSYTDLSVTNGTQYFYVVSAFNGSDSAYSNEITTQSVSSFTISSVTSPSSTSLQVSWGAVTGATAYDVRWGTNSGTYSGTTLNTTSPYTISGLAANTTYYVIVRAKNSIGAGSSTNSTEVSIKTATAAPTSLIATASPGQVGLNWTAASGAASYKVFRGTSSGSYSEIANNVSGTAYLDTTVTDGITYFYAVVSSNGSDSAYSNEVSVKPIGTFNLTAATAASSSSVNLTWTAATGASAYDVRYGTSSGVYLTTVTNVTSPYTLTGLTDGVIYYISIRARNSIGSGSLSDSNERTVLTAPDAPTSVAASSVTGQINLTWITDPGATNYRIYRGTTSGSYTQIATGVSGSTYSDTTVTNGTQYFYSVRSFNGTESGDSNEATATPIAAFSISSTSAPTSNSIQVTWGSANGASVYDVRYGTISGSYSTTVSGVTSPYTISGLASGTNYFVIVRARNLIGSGGVANSPEVSQITPIDPPTGLAATATPSAINLSWTAAGGASSYKVLRGTSSGGEVEIANSIASTSYSDTTAVNGTTYYYVVRSFNGADSANSNEVSSRSISNFSITSAIAQSASSIQVTWPAVAGASVYDLKYGTTAGNYTTTLSSQTSPTTITGLSAGSTYYFVIVAKNSIGSGASVQSAEVGAATAFGAPSGLAATSIPGQVNLTWNSVSGATNYKVFRGTASGTYTEIASSVSTNSYSDSTITNGTIYFYVVRASNGTDSANSNEATARPISTFTFTSAVTASASTIDLTWASATGASSYDIRYGTSAGSYSLSVSGVTSPYTLSGLTAGTTYYISVRAKNTTGSGTSVDSSELSAKTSPSAPGTLTASATTGQIVLNWTSGSGATNYNIYRGTTSGSYTQIASAINALTYTDSTITNGTQYFYVVRSNNGTESVNSSEATAQSIAAFAISSTTAPSTSTITVSWPAASGATAYDVRYGTSTGSYGTTLSDVTSPFTITGLTGATNYYIVVRARNTIGSGASAHTAEVMQVTPLGAPLNLTASSTPGSVALTWSTVSGASSYKVYRGTVSGTYSQLASGVSTNSYTDSTAVNGTQYFYVVKAYNGADSADSSEATTKPMANFAITSTSSPSSTSVQISWTGPTGAATYDIRYGTATGSYSTTVSSVTSPYTISGLNAGTTYYMVVRANNSIGSGTSVISSESSQLTALGAPTGLLASATPGSVGLNWTAMPAASNFKVYRGTTSGSLSLLASGVATNAYMDTTVTDGVTYYYTVVANNGSDSAQSSEVSIQSISSFSLTAATAASASSINLTWGSATGATSYDVRYGTSPGVYLTTVSNVTSPYTLSSLSAGTTYYISIQAKNAVGAGTVYNSNEMNAKTAVGAPSGLAALSTPSNVALSWNTVSGATNYNVYRSLTTGGPYSQIASAVNALTYNDNTVTNGTTYFYVVRTYNGIESANSAEISTQPIANFTLASATVNSASSAGVSWGAASGATTYDVRIGTASGTYTTTYPNVTSPYTITGLSPATLYYVRIRANNTIGAGSSNSSNEVSFTTTTAAPTTLTASATTGQVSLNWIAASGASSYRVYRSTTSGSGYSQIASGITLTNYTDSTISNGTQYYYVVRAYNGTESIDSNEATATPIGTFSITSTSSPTTSTIEVTWGMASGATTYDVRYGTASGTYSTTAAGVSSPYTITGLAANTTYYIIVRARNTVGSVTSANTAEVSQITPVAAPSGLVAQGGTSLVNLSWTAASGASSYKVFRGTVSGSLTQIASGITGTTYTDNTAVNGTTYFYALKSFNGSDSAISSEVTTQPISSFAISSITGPSTTSISVTWGSATGATAYDLKYGTVSGTYTTTLTSVTSPYTVTGLTAGTTYYIQIVAKNTIGTGTTVSSSQSSGATNSAPVLSAVSNQTAEAPASIAAGFTLTDSNDILSCSTSMTGSSSDTTLVPNTNITFSGTMPNCTATVTPAVGQIGTATITITATDLKTTTSTTFDVSFTPCVVASIAWEVQPGNISAGSTWATAPKVSLRKADNSLCTTNTNPVSFAVTLDTSNQQDAAVTGGNPVTPVGGYATFSTATMTRAGTGYKIAAGQDSIVSLDSNAFNVTALAASKVIWAVQPSTTNRTSNMIPAPTVRVTDTYGNWVAQSGLSVTVSLQDNTEGATLGGTLTRSTDATGAATFTALTLNVLGNYYLRAAPATSYAAINSDTFDIIQIVTQNTVAVMEMLNGSMMYTGNGNTSYPGAGISFGTDNIDGSTTYTWKIVATNTDTQNATIRLKVGSTNISSITVPSGTTAPTLFSTSISNASITNTGVWSLGSFKGGGTIYSSRVIVQQTNATRTQVYIPLTSQENSATTTLASSTTSSTFNQPNAMNFPAYIYDTSKLARVDSILLYVTSRASGGSSCVALFNKGTGSQIGTEICNNSASDSIVSTSISPSSIPTGTEIEVRMRNSTNGSTAYLTRAGLLVRLVSIEKMLAIQRIAPAVATLNVTTNFVEQRASSYISNYGTGAISEYVYCRAKAVTNGAGSFIYKNHGSNTSGVTSPTTITASTINYSTQSSFTSLEAGPVATTNGNNQFMNYTHTSGSFGLSHCLMETEVAY